LFNHDQIHQVAHSLPIAMALARVAPHVDIVVATTNERLSAEVRRISAAHGVTLPSVELTLRRPLTRFARRLEAILPITKLGIYRDNLDFFASLDMLVVAEKTSLLLKSHYHLDNLRIIHTRHGAGDRANGFDKASAKFDLLPKVPVRLPFQDNGKPTVLYNPHPSPHLSSWYRHGRAVLDHFLNDDRYNLIFAPHVMLFHRRFVLTIDKLRIDRPGLIDRRVKEAPNIHVDLGSRASTDMSYTSAADIYLGDVSSQVYEFLHRPRPCLFLNSQNAEWRGNPNYAHWQTGEVIADPTDLGAALDRAIAEHAHYLPMQQELFRRSFDLTEESSADRAAKAILGSLARPVQQIVPAISSGAGRHSKRPTAAAA
jgi:hypothetical protein